MKSPPDVEKPEDSVLRSVEARFAGPTRFATDCLRIDVSKSSTKQARSERVLAWPAMSRVHFIGGEKGGVGKSVVARLVTQNCIDKSLPFAAVDADSSHATLARHYADYARQGDLARLESMDEVVALATETDRRVIVDLPAQSDRLLSAWIAESGVLELTRDAGCPIVLWHVMDDGKDALAALERLLDRYQREVSYAIVRNYGRGKDFSLFDKSPVRAKASDLGAHVIDLPELPGGAMQKIDRLDASFWAAVHNASFGADALSRMDRQRIKVWLQASFEQIARLGEAF